MKKIHPIKSLTQDYVLTVAIIWVVIWSILYFIGLIGVYTYAVYAISGILIILVDWYGSQEHILALGVLWTLVFIVMYFMGIINNFSDVIYEIPGVIMIFIALYNWGAGMDFAHRQESPIENREIA